MGPREDFFNTFDRYPRNNLPGFYQCVLCKINMHISETVQQGNGRIVSRIAVDHIHPKSLSLSRYDFLPAQYDPVNNVRLNLQPLCIPCNSIKSNSLSYGVHMHFGHWIRQ